MTEKQKKEAAKKAKQAEAEKARLAEAEILAQMNAQGANGAPLPIPADASPTELQLEPLATLEETPEVNDNEFYIADHTIKVNGVFYNTGDKVPKV